MTSIPRPGATVQYLSDLPDLGVLLDRHLAARPPRGDKAFAHMSAVICDRQAWAERSGLPFRPFDARTLMKMALGVQYEDVVGDAIEAQLGDDWAVTRNVAIAWNPYTLDRRVLFDGDKPNAREIIGHADFVARNYTTHRGFVLEIKSTSFLRGKPPVEPASHYFEQAMMYAAAYKLPFGILVGCRESGLKVGWWYDENEYRDAAIARAQEIIEATDPATFMPPAEPRTTWACRNCRFTGCERNPDHDATLRAVS